MVSKHRILVVDDDRSFRHLLLETGLADDQFEIIVASSAAECTERIAADEPHLLLLDLNLPDGNDVYARVIEHVERHLLSRMLVSTQGNQTVAAKRLGITRGSLRFKLKNLGLTIDSKVKMPNMPR